MITIPTYVLGILAAAAGLAGVVTGVVKVIKRLKVKEEEKRTASWDVYERRQETIRQDDERKEKEMEEKRKKHLPGVWLSLWKEMDENNNKVSIIFDSFMYKLDRQEGTWEKITHLNGKLYPEMKDVSKLMPEGVSLILWKIQERHRAVAMEKLLPYTSSGVFWHQI